MKALKAIGNLWLIIWNCLWYLIFGAIAIGLLFTPPWGWVILLLVGIYFGVTKSKNE